MLPPSEKKAPSPPPRLPWISIVVPVVLALVFTLVWSSPYALLIGGLAPTLALGHWWESRRRHRREAETAEAEYDQALATWHRLVETDQRDFVIRELARSPHPEAWADNPLWHPLEEGGAPIIRVGLTRGPGPHQHIVTGLPAHVDISSGVVVVGSSETARALWRVVVLGICAHAARLDPPVHSATLWGPFDHPSDTICAFDATTQAQALRVDTIAEVPRGIRTALLVSDTSTTLVVDGVAQAEPIRPDSISVSAAKWVRDDLAAGLGNVLEAVRTIPAADDRGQLAIQLRPDVLVDLVDDGPHAVIWGQTGSGKSVVIRQIIHSIAQAYRPDQVSVVAIDFKGGIGTSTVTNYPHVVGCLTDLTPPLVYRVAEGIRAEIRRRESLLVSARVDSIASLGADISLARTVIIVDEVGTLIQQYPQWEALLGDIASRGRALGLHLIVASQRISGHIPRNLVVNAPLRICFRVADRSEAADYLPGVPPGVLTGALSAPAGRAVIATATGSLATVDVVETTTNSARDGIATPLWCEPLLDVVSLPTPALFVIDRPTHQDHLVCGPADVPPGLLWLRGEAGTGLSSSVARWAELEAHSLVVPPDPAECVEVIRQLRERELVAPPLIVIDHLDRILVDMPPATLSWAIEALSMIARWQRESHTQSHLVVTTAPRGEYASLLSRHADQAWSTTPRNHEAWRERGLPAQLFDANAPAGRFLVDHQLAQWVCPALEDPACSPITFRDGGRNPVELVVSGELDEARFRFDATTAIDLSQADRMVADIDRAYRRGTLALHGMPSAALSPFIRHHPPLPHPGESRIWRVGVDRWWLTEMPAR